MSTIYRLDYFKNMDADSLVADDIHGYFGSIEAAQRKAESLEGEPLEWVPETEVDNTWAYALDGLGGYVIAQTRFGGGL